MHRLRRRSTALAIAALLACTGALVARAQDGLALANPTSRALAYLDSQLQADGSLQDSVNETADLAMGLAAAGFDPRTVSSPSPEGYLCSQLPLETSVSDTADLAAAVLGLVASGVTPASCSSGALTLLLTTDSNTTSTGAFGDGETETQSLAILALVATGQTVPAAAVTYLLSTQDSDDGFNYAGPSASSSNPGSDTNSTAMALMALNATGNTTANTSATAWLATQQDSDGGFPYQTGFGTDPDSTALVIQGLVAAGQDPSSATWAVGGVTPVAALIAEQDPTTGGYIYPGSTGPDPFTTSQVPLGLLSTPMPVAAPAAAGITPASLALDELHSVDYLVAQQSSTGGITGDSGDSLAEDTVIAVADTGADPSTVTADGSPSLVAYLEADAAADSAASAGSDADLIMAAVAAHVSPTNFGGVNLIAALNADYGTTTAGAYGSGTGDTFTQSLAILALLDAGQVVPAAAVTYLESLELTPATGEIGWGYETGQPSDSNSTALALMALNAAGLTSANNAALQWLQTVQDSDGGFQFQSTDGSDPDSTALVIEAIIATGGNPESPAWTAAGGSPTAYLLSTQSADGGFIEPGNVTPDAFTTSEVPQALLRVAFPGTATYVAGTTLASLAPATTTPTSTTGSSVPVPFTGGTHAPAASAAPSRDTASGGLSLTTALWGVLLAAMGAAAVTGAPRRRALR